MSVLNGGQTNRIQLWLQFLFTKVSNSEGLRIIKHTLEVCPLTINTSMGGSEQTSSITRSELLLQLRPNDVMNAISMKMKAIVTVTKSYDVLVGAMVLYPMELTLDFWEEIAFYRPRPQLGDGRKVQLRARCFHGGATILI